MTFDWNVNLADLIPGAIKIAGIIIMAFVLIFFFKRLVYRIITTRIPRIRHESQDQLTQRAQTLSNVISQAISIIIWIIAAIMIIGVIGINIAPVLASVWHSRCGNRFCRAEHPPGLPKRFLHCYRGLGIQSGEVATLAGLTGMVVNMNLRRTTLRDLSGNMHIIPNSKIEMATK